MAAPKTHAKAGGRKAGVPNKVNRELREIAQSYSEEAIETAARLMRNGRVQAAARLQAVNIILDRAFGKPPQATIVTGANNGPVQVTHTTDEDRVKALMMLLQKTKGQIT